MVFLILLKKTVSVLDKTLIEIVTEILSHYLANQKSNQNSTMPIFVTLAVKFVI